MKLNRRDFLKLSAAGAGGSLLVGCDTDNPRRNPEKPNIIYIMVDQLRYKSCGYAGDEKAVTPNIDRFCLEGVNFRQTVSSMPVCSAYRASLFTGKYTTSTGMVINELRMNPNHTCLGHVLTAAGYQTGYIGKWHLYANQLGHHNDPKNSFVPRGPDRLGFDGYWAAYNFHHDYYGSYYHTESPEKIYYGDGVYEPDAQTDLAVNYIEQAVKKEKPFALVVSYGPPHDPWKKDNVPQKYYDMFKDVKFPPPPGYSDEVDPYGDNWSNTRKSPALLDEWMRCYYAMTANLDWNIGRIMDTLKKTGIDEDTLVVFTSDHGEMFGAHGRMKKNIFYEEAARVPFLMRYRGTIPSGLVSDACFNTVDIMPTILGLSGLADKIPNDVEGMDLSHLALGKTGDEPQAAFLMNTGAVALWEDGHEWRAMRNKKFTYAVFRGGGKLNLPKKELFFDNINDPYQMKNLINDAKYITVVENFRAMLKAKMNQLNDTFAASTWYRDNWIKDRIILRSAKG